MHTTIFNPMSRYSEPRSNAALQFHSIVVALDDAPPDQWMIDLAAQFPRRSDAKLTMAMTWPYHCNLSSSAPGNISDRPGSQVEHGSLSEYCVICSALPFGVIKGCRRG